LENLPVFQTFGSFQPDFLFNGNSSGLHLHHFDNYVIFKTMFYKDAINFMN